MFQSCELLENRPQTNEGLEKGVNFMIRDVTENSGESKNNVLGRGVMVLR